MIEIIPTEKQISDAIGLYDFDNLNNSITKGASQKYGALGEVLVADYYGVELDNTYDYDLIIDNVKVDVKTKRTTVKPKDFYNVSIDASNTKQKCDYYLFVRILEDMSKAWLLGYYGKRGFMSDAVFKKKGDPDGEYYKFKSDSYHMRIGNLGRISDIKIDKDNKKVV